VADRWSQFTSRGCEWNIRLNCTTNSLAPGLNGFSLDSFMQKHGARPCGNYIPEYSRYVLRCVICFGMLIGC